MIPGLKLYPRMKETGVRWFGGIPERWQAQRLKTVCTMASGNAITAKSIEPKGKYPVYGGNGLRGFTFDNTHDGTFVLVGRQGALCGNVHVVNGKFWASEHAVVATARSGHDANWLGATLEIMNLRQHSIAAAQPGLAVERVLNLWLPVPSGPEQTAIARFLDHMDRRIQKYIRAKEKLIALLDEYKQALIHQAVTGQIDVRTGKPYPAYKPSGVKWLEDVPAHWTVSRLKSLVARIDQGVSPQADNHLAEGRSWGVLKAGCVNGGVFRETEHKRLAPTFVVDINLAVRIGDVLVSRANGSPHLVGSVGRISSLKRRLILSDKTFRPIFKREIDSDFMVFAMNSRYYRHQVEQAISGAEGLANNLPLSSLRAFWFVVPNANEQQEIVRHLQTWTKRLSAAIEQTAHTMYLLKKFRTRLIADVVTGKLDVREAAAELTDTAAIAWENGIDTIQAESHSHRAGHAIAEEATA